VFTRAELVERVWHHTLGHDGRPVPRDSRTVDVHVSRVRRKLGPRHGQCLVTEYRVGYQFRPRPA
jgi:Response regulators consisting of a CheY-like receiver domain and a winged-helix DNA-binding domain